MIDRINGKYVKSRNIDGSWLVASASLISDQSIDFQEYQKLYVYGDGNFNFNSIQTSSIKDDRLYYYEIQPTGSQTITITNDINDATDNFGASIPISGSETSVGNIFKNVNGDIRIVISPLE